MRARFKLLATVLSAIFLTEIVKADDTTVKDVGDFLPISVRNSTSIEGCYLTTPNGDVITFLPESNNTDARYQYSPSPPLRVCSVTVNNLTADDNGVWRLTSTTVGENDAAVETEESVHNLVVVQENPTLEDNQTKLLSEITHQTRTGLYIDIALSKTDYDEECVLYTPIKVDDNNSFNTNGTYHYSSSLDSLDIEGVRKQMSSDYVSCRVTIGPMEENLLGSWSLCGTQTTTQIKRCQPITITWRSSSIPSSNWQTTTHPMLHYPVHFGGEVNPTIRGEGDVETCHVITPNGEDLVLTPDTTYPNISLASYSDSSLCGAHIGPLHRNHLGDWTVYGRFSSWTGFNEVVQPFNFSLYDEENPYEQAYNVTVVVEPLPREVRAGDTIILDVTSSGDVNDCLFRTPDGQSYSHKNSHQTMDNVELSVINQTKSICRISVGPIDKFMLGEWQLTGKFESRGVFTERRHTFSIRLEDPENPWQDDTREIVNLNPQLSNVQFGGTTRATISTSVLEGSIDSCHIRTPNGLQYIVRDGLNIDGVSVMTNSLSECSIRIQVESEDTIGDWMLITRETRLQGNSLERRLNFTIYVEEFVQVLPRNVILATGGNLHFRLENATELYDTCKLFAPNNVEASKGYLDTAFADQCAYIVPNVTTEDEGTWEIRYGTKIIHRGQITLSVLDVDTEAVYLNWTNGSPVDEVFGPDDAVYCIVRDPYNHTVHEGFGKCRIVLERASNDHSGVWSMIVGLPGKVITQKHDVYVTITDDESKAFANTTVVKSNAEDMMVALSCSVSSEHQVRACKFREPSGRVLLATEGVGQDRYHFHGMGTSYESGIYSHECGLRIANPTVQDFGLWRCAIETVEETYYGFLSVLCPWAIQDPTIAAQVVSEPKLTAERELVTVMEGENVDVSCYVQSAIRYCYFRSSNGSIYNVGSDLEYVGAGFDAGECGGRLPRVQVNDSGTWSCHVGLTNHSVQEQRANFEITVEDALKVTQARIENSNHLWISAVAYQNHSLDYCRFVRIDGYGFTTENIPNDYLDDSDLSSGRCAIFIVEATLLDHHPWTVVARFSGLATEISRVTTHTIQEDNRPTTGIRYSFLMTSVTLLVTALLLLLCGSLMFPKKNREWTYARASSLSNSIRSSILKKSLGNKPKTAMAA